MGTCRVVIEQQPRSGALNMAADEALLEAAIERRQCTVRWYRWETATVSLGYFQDASAAHSTPGLAGLPVVRRLSGGGAILHHHEWTYSCAVPVGHRLTHEPGRIYELVHEQILTALSEFGVRAALRGEAQSERDAAFLCFGRGDRRDIVLHGHKIVGSAQRRRRGSILQHGSVLLRRSEYAPQFPGVLDLMTGAPSQAEFDGDFARRAAQLTGSVFGEAVVADGYDRTLENRAIELQRRYQTLDWGRSHPAPVD